ncbi:MAG: ribosome small subunit-dependent GTPase A [Actinomycetota bacterium]|nr:ribosome small subunit-dependent GTPase A [Actinomycetota bacterium]
MNKHDRLDESDVRARPGRRGSRPRTKRRPEHADAVMAMVVGVDRGRWTCVLDGDPTAQVTAMRARELGRTPVVVGDQVGLVGDLAPGPESLARIVRVAERTSVLRRTADDTDPYERVVVANAEQLLVVTALADPPPRTGLIDRCLVAAYAGGLEPVLCLTKRDLVGAADVDALVERYRALEVPVLVTGPSGDLGEVRGRLGTRLSALVGHSGVGKSTLVNRLVPSALRTTAEVSAVGKGRHTSTSAVALPLAGGGWVVDTPGIRSFGLAHVSADDVVAAFGDLAAAIADCPRGCTHLGPPADPECALDELTGTPWRRAESVRALLTALTEGRW